MPLLRKFQNFLEELTPSFIHRIQLLSYFQATDTSLDDTGGDVEITDGGIGHKYVEVRLQSRIGKDLDYVIIAYHDETSATNTTQV